MKEITDMKIIFITSILFFYGCSSRESYSLEKDDSKPEVLSQTNRKLLKELSVYNDKSAGVLDTILKSQDPFLKNLALKRIASWDRSISFKYYRRMLSDTSAVIRKRALEEIWNETDPAKLKEIEIITFELLNWAEDDFLKQAAKLLERRLTPQMRDNLIKIIEKRRGSKVALFELLCSHHLSRSHSIFVTKNEKQLGSSLARCIAAVRKAAESKFKDRLNPEK